MAMTKLYDLAVVTRKYTKDGQEKANWLNIGSIFMGDNNPFIMLKAHFNPAGLTRKENSESILVSMFTPKDSSYSYDNFCWTQIIGRKLYDLCVGTRKYTVNGQEKTVWENVGAIIMGEKNPYLMLKAHFNPAAIQRKEGSESIVISMFKPKDKSQPDDVSYLDAQDYYASADSYGGASDFTSMSLEEEAGFSPQPSANLDPSKIPF